MKRGSGARTVRLSPGRDILASLAPLKRAQTVVAFAAETEDLEARGRRKMESKGADLIVVNDVGKPGIGFDAELVRKKALGGEVDLADQPFLRQVLVDEWDRVGGAFQDFLSAGGLSSNMWLVGRRPG